MAAALGVAWVSLSSLLVLADTNDLITGEGFVFRTWGTEAGLPQNTVNAILQTRDGYLWLGTQGGLARFDGVRFTVFGLSQGLSSVQVRTLYEDTRGNLWIGTTGGGLCRMRDGQFETISIEDGLAGVNVSAITEDADGRVWIGTSEGLSVWQEGKFVQLEGLATLNRSLIRTLSRDRRGAMWISTPQGLLEFKNHRLTETVGPENDRQITTAYCLLEDKSGNLWASIGNGKVLCRRNGVWLTYDESTGLPFAYISSLAEGDDGTIWAGSLDAGLYYFRDGRFFVIHKQDGLSGDAIRSLYADHEGNLWVGTRTSGLNRVARRKLTVLGFEQGLTNDFVRSVAESADGSLWVGTIGGGVYRGWPGRFEPVPSVIGTVTYPFIEAVVATGDSSLWWGGAGCLFQWKDGKLATTYTRADCHWLADTTVTALLEDRQEGLWIGTSQGALLKYRNGVVTAFTNRVARGSVTSLVQATNGTLWVGSVAGGLCRLDPNGETSFLTNRSLNIHIRALHLDKEGTLWIGTGGGGLNRWKDGRIARLTTQQGLGDDTISQILEDDDGNLWLGCNRGIYRVRKTELNELADGKRIGVHPRVFGLNDGMPAEECSGDSCPAGLRTRSGQLCFSTVRGLVLIDPRRQERDARVPRVMTEEVSVGGELQTLSRRIENPGDQNSPLLGVTIPPGQSEFEFHYTGLSFSAPEQIRFRYRLDGLDQNWVEAGQRRAAYFHQLPPGEFVFRVSACNADGVWSEEAAALAVTVLPHVWETGWFRASAGLLSMGLLGGTVYWVVRRRYKRRLAVLETQHAVERERLRISQDMHDDIGGILTRVSMLSDVGESGVEREGMARGQFERIGAQVRSAVQALDEIVWATNPKNDNLRRFADYVGLFADEFFEGSPVRCWQEMPTDLPNLPLRADVRHNVFLAVKEAFNNVMKHSGATEIWLRLTFEDSTVRLSIEDNGRGFRLDQASAGGNGLENMKTRLAECGGSAQFASASGQGTKISFRFSLSGDG